MWLLTGSEQEWGDIDIGTWEARVGHWVMFEVEERGDRKQGDNTAICRFTTVDIKRATVLMFGIMKDYILGFCICSTIIVVQIYNGNKLYHTFLFHSPIFNSWHDA